MNQTYVTVQGFVGTDVELRTAKDVRVASFRVACTPRVKRGDSWEDGETTWYSVTAWRSLAEHVKESLRRGDPVIVHGRLTTSTWVKDEGATPVIRLELEATTAGHDLSLGTTAFLRARRGSGQPTVAVG